VSDRTKHTTARDGSRRAPKAVTEALATPGRALDSGVRSALESRLGHSFGDVRVHADATAAAAARSVGADTFALGTDIVFAEGRYSPETLRGRALLAHELAHVAQQGHRRADATRAFDVAPGGDTVEAEAARVVTRLAAVACVEPGPAGGTT